jgi:hypothetical protein
MVREAETREGGASQPAGSGWWDRLQNQLLGWVAERVVEQRLLWNLRREDAARLVYPGDMTADQAQTLLKRILGRDHDRHRRWLVVHSILLAISGPLLFFVPGPNLVAYYFAFRVVGHWFSMRGAAQGLRRMAWSAEASARLVDVRQAILHEPRLRLKEVGAIGADLGLPSLAMFIERVATR